MCIVCHHPTHKLSDAVAGQRTRTCHHKASSGHGPTSANATRFSTVWAVKLDAAAATRDTNASADGGPMYRPWNRDLSSHNAHVSHEDHGRSPVHWQTRDTAGRQRASAVDPAACLGTVARGAQERPHGSLGAPSPAYAAPVLLLTCLPQPTHRTWHIHTQTQTQTHTHTSARE